MRPSGSSLLAALVSSLLALAALEVGLSFWRPLQLSRFEPDARLLFRLRPGFRTSLSFPAPGGARRTVDFVVNSRGDRGPELSRLRTGARVVVYGDSYVEAYSSPESETFVAKLGQRLRPRLGRPVEVVNAGVAGYGPDQAWLRLENELALLKPDAVVVALFAGNDFGDLVRNKIFRLDAAGRLTKSRYQLSPEIQAGLASRGMSRLALWRAFRFVHRRLLDRMRPPPEPSPAWALRECEREWQDYRSGDPFVTNPFVDHYDADMSLRPGSAPALVKRRLMTGVLGLMRGQAALLRVPLLAMLIPAPEDLRSAPPADELRSHSAYRAEALTDALELAARDSGVRVVSLFEAFRKRGGDALYDEHDLHWNAEAQELAARLVAEALPR